MHTPAMRQRTLMVAAAGLLAAACDGTTASTPRDATVDAPVDAARADVVTDAASDATADVPRIARPIAYQPGSPWPKFRGNAVQDGLSTVHVGTTGDHVWSFRTGKGVFSSPIVGADETIYVGSADQAFYALHPDGTLRWRFDTGEIIDSSGLLDDLGRVYVGSGDGHLYALDAATGARVWTFDAEAPTQTMAYINWFEGNVALGPEGDLYVPNDNFRVYRIDRTTGHSVWGFHMPDQTWSLPAVDAVTGNLYIGNNNLLRLLGSNTFALRPDGTALWRQSTNGSIAASPLLTPDGAMVVGGFDGYLRAYDRDTGDPRWTFGAHDHLYASPARLPDGTIVQPAADGTLYALDPSNGHVRWAFDTREAIRSSPAVDADGNTYFGGGDGKLYVVRSDGTLRWALRLLPDERHNLNASPALGRQGIYLAGEDGEVFGVPYDYCLRAAGMADPRCIQGPNEDLPRDGVFLSYTTPTGVPLDAPPATLDANGILAFSLFVRAGGDTRLALIDSRSFTATATPAADLDVRVSGDRRFVVIVPRTRLTAGADGHVHIALRGSYLTDPMRDGLHFTGGTAAGSLDTTLDVTLSASGPATLPLPVPAASTDPSGQWELSRLAAPLPTILPSYNQIGFDSLRFLVGMVERSGSGAIGWIAGGMPGPGGRSVVDPHTHALFPVQIDYDGGLVTLRNENSLSLEVMNFRLPFETFRVTARVDATGNAVATPALAVTTQCANVMVYGMFLRTLGFCNPDDDRLSAYGATLLHAMDPQSAPTGVGTVTFAADATSVTATLAGSTLRAADQALSVLVVDAVTGAPLSLDYGPATTVTAATDGTVQSVRVALGTRALPASSRVYLMVGTYPAARGALPPH